MMLRCFEYGNEHLGFINHGIFRGHCCCKCMKGKVLPITGHEGPEGE
jgi:hypothetical protein